MEKPGKIAYILNVVHLYSFFTNTVPKKLSENITFRPDDSW